MEFSDFCRFSEYFVVDGLGRLKRGIGLPITNSRFFRDIRDRENISTEIYCGALSFFESSHLLLLDDRASLLSWEGDSSSSPNSGVSRRSIIEEEAGGEGTIQQPPTPNLDEEEEEVSAPTEAAPDTIPQATEVAAEESGSAPTTPIFRRSSPDYSTPYGGE